VQLTETYDEQADSDMRSAAGHAQTGVHQQGIHRLYRLESRQGLHTLTSACLSVRADQRVRNTASLKASEGRR
jgi:hypothetical protein